MSKKDKGVLGGVGTGVVDTLSVRSRKPREKTRYVLERMHALDNSAAMPDDSDQGDGWVPLVIEESGEPVKIPDFSDASEAMAWVEKNASPPARVRCVVVKFDVELVEETIKRNVVKPVA